MQPTSADVQRLRTFFASSRKSLARTMLNALAMRADETWTIPLQVIMWTTIVVGLIMAMVVVLMH